MGVRSLGNALSSFGYKFGTTGLEAVTPYVAPTFNATGGTKIPSAQTGKCHRQQCGTQLPPWPPPRAPAG